MMVQLELRARTWGGWRKGAGARPGKGRRPTPHRARPVHKDYHPVHLTMRARRGLPSLRAPRLYRVIRDAIRVASRDDFRIVHFSVQGDHLHLIVEADSGRALSSGARGLSIRLAHTINRTLGRRGGVWGDRYHTRALKTPLEMRNCIVYVLMNVKKHQPGRFRRLDPCSSAPWFDGFDDIRPSQHAPPVRRPRTWMAIEGWRRHGLISSFEAPSLQ